MRISPYFDFSTHFGDARDIANIDNLRKKIRIWESLEKLAMMNKKRLLGIALSLVGFIVGWVGFGMWRSPELDWGGFKQTGAIVLKWFGDEIVRLVTDPFAILGIVVMVAGVIVLIKGIAMATQKSER